MSGCGACGFIAADAVVLRRQGGQCAGCQDTDFAWHDHRLFRQPWKHGLDHAIAHDRLEMGRLLTAMGAQIDSLSLSKSQAMEALLKEVREKRGAHRESRKRKRDVHSSACPNGQRRSAIVSWTYSDTEAEEPEILREDGAVIHENIWRSRQRQPRGSGARHLSRKKRTWTCRAFVPGTSWDFASGFDIVVNMHISILILTLILLSILYAYHY